MPRHTNISGAAWQAALWLKILHSECNDHQGVYWLCFVLLGKQDGQKKKKLSLSLAIFTYSYKRYC